MSEQISLKNPSEKERVAQEVRTLLTESGIDFSSWGTGTSKTIDHLIEEVCVGETKLVKDENGEVVRKLSVIILRVICQTPDGKTWLLKEDKQVFNDGRERKKDLNGSIFEKIKPDENLGEAARRALTEELNIRDVSQISFMNDDVETLDSPSYPGLKSVYTKHNAEVQINPSDFRQDGYKEEQSDKTTYFAWEQID
jgi:hypothetical protein